MNSIPKEGTAQYGAYRKGQEAAKAGKPKESCPYEITSYMARSFKKYWLSGWNSKKVVD